MIYNKKNYNFFFLENEVTIVPPVHTLESPLMLLDISTVGIKSRVHGPNVDKMPRK